MSDHIFYCPKCGDISIEFDENEHYCTNTSTCKKVKMINTHKNSDYFFEKTPPDENGFQLNWKEAVRKEFIYDNPLYNREADMKIRADYEKIHERNLKATQLREAGIESENIPKCPTCGSTNIHKISGANKVTKGTLFGLFAVGKISKTFQCDNCKYEW